GSQGRRRQDPRQGPHRGQGDRHARAGARSSGEPVGRAAARSRSRSRSRARAATAARSAGVHPRRGAAARRRQPHAPPPQRAAASMILVLAHRRDLAARHLVDAWQPHGTRLVTLADLSRSGWRYYLGDAGAGTAVASGELVPAAAISGVLTRIPWVTPEDL